MIANNAVVAEVVAEMSPAQIRLLSLREALAYPNEAARRQDMRFAAWRRGVHVDAPEMDAIRARLESVPLATDREFSGWERSPWWVAAGDTPIRLLGQVRVGSDGRMQTAYLVLCRQRHGGCGGTQLIVSPGHYRCTKCRTEVKLWEHGIGLDDTTTAGLRQQGAELTHRRV